ncbi:MULTISPECIES: hypothetical protein [Bradyrhizobium]|uniref:hypothetical protein n=1 Tax=Bradyrhizobium TaxID=374 RepID=UPI001B8A62A7|nr:MULTISPECIES: hypothetical protein [Bradyrhizobium]MBR0970628.1 hypothetical protein [Bradyrhizobium japonicum]
MAPNTDSSLLNLNTLISVTLAAQFALFQLRIKREIDVGDNNNQTWFPVPDIINILMMLIVVVFCVVLPLAHHQKYDNTSILVFTVAAVLLAFHPICMIGHYRLFSKKEREQGRRTPIMGKSGVHTRYCTGQEAFLIGLALVCALAAGGYVMRSM